jgi:hypothetical protein
MRLTQVECWDRLHAADHGVLCTAGGRSSIAAVPVCFSVVDDAIASPIDTVKPKETTDLHRLADLERNPVATLLCEHWDGADWSRLWWVRAQLHLLGEDRTSVAFRRECEAALRTKYEQYRKAEFAHMLVFDVTSLTGWRAGESVVSAAGPE